MSKQQAPSKQEIRKQLESQMDKMVDTVYSNLSQQIEVKNQGKITTHQQKQYDVQLSYCQKCGCCGAAEHEKQKEHLNMEVEQRKTVFDTEDQGKQILDYFQM